MVGMLGTVIGMVNVFLDMEAAERFRFLFRRNKTAMVTTIVGLG